MTRKLWSGTGGGSDLIPVQAIFFSSWYTNPSVL
jgi:hypothetical protein